MDISLSPDNEKFIQKQIADGIYASINEAINAAINLDWDESINNFILFLSTNYIFSCIFIYI